MKDEGQKPPPSCTHLLSTGDGAQRDPQSCPPKGDAEDINGSFPTNLRATVRKQTGIEQKGTCVNSADVI